MLCSECTNKTCLKTGKPCKIIEKYFQKEGIYSRDYIRPQLPRSIKKQLKKRGVKDNVKWREIPFSSMPIQWQLEHLDRGNHVVEG